MQIPWADTFLNTQFALFRFDRTNEDCPWDTGNGSTDGICFSVETEGVMLCGVGVYGGGKNEYKFDLKVLGQVIRLLSFRLDVTNL